MKNKIFTLIFALIIQVSTAYCQPLMNDECYSEAYAQTFASDDTCSVQNGYRYFSIGVGPIIFIPNVGIGYKQRYSQFGWDTGLSFSSIGYVHQLNGYLVGHYYLSPFRQNSAYLGLGVTGSGVITNHSEGGGTLSPDFVFGKELESSDASRHFIEMHVAIPSIWINSKHTNAMYLPLMYIKYGISF